MTIKKSLNKNYNFESLEYDVVIIGAGPSGLSSAIRIKQNALKKNININVCIIEKGIEVGAHILSGAIINPLCISELISNWENKKAPISINITDNKFLFFTEKYSFKIPSFFIPDIMKNSGNYIVSLSNLTKWLAKEAQDIGVEIFTGFTASGLLYNNNGSIGGVVVNSMPINNFSRKSNLKETAVYAKYTLFCEGSYGYLTQKIIKEFKLNYGDPQTYSIGLKELWKIDPCNHKLGSVIQTIGWPLNKKTYGGSFFYHINDNKVVIGLIAALSYKDPNFSPFDAFQKYKKHPEIIKFLEGGKRIGYGARALTTGGFLSLPKLVFPGGVIVGDAAGFLNSLSTKGIHSAIKTGIFAADAVFDALVDNRSCDELTLYSKLFKKSLLYKELYSSRNFNQWMNKGMFFGSLMISIEQKLFFGNIPWTLHRYKLDHEKLSFKSKNNKTNKFKADNQITFDRSSSVYYSNINSTKNQYNHLILKNANVPININLKLYGGPESYYCPAGVYKFIDDNNGNKKLVINFHDCIHCKTCEIKDPTQNIIWTPPGGGIGPNYKDM